VSQPDHADPTTPPLPSPLFEGVAGRLREFLEDEGLSVGDKLPPERTLAVRLGVSRASLREGLTALRVIGLIDIRHGDGIRLIRRIDDVVPPIGREVSLRHPDLPAVGEARNALEALAARLAAQRHVPADLAAMRAALAQMEAEIARDESGLEGDRAFHAAIVVAARNAVVEGLLQSIEDSVRTIAAASLARPGQSPRSLDTHRLIYDAIVAGDGEEAGRLMLEHLAITGEMLA